ncbi:MAG: ABC transporter ATP-binding protein [Thermoplasmata archaeon]|nr:ABC transporter ATP-binding protein [Thermoplasmata archaeon]MCI4362138.1 ABC transporter ATP-binding protein [Thermoplasmata archaeon]
MRGGRPGSDGVPLVVDQLEVRYGERTAVRSVSFQVAPGTIFGLLGSNGAGKTSTIKSILGLVPRSGGSIRVFGEDPATDTVAVRANVGYVPESTLLYDALTPREFLEYVSGVRGLATERVAPRAAAFAKAFRLEEEFDTPIVALSNGTRQKVVVVAALLHEPGLLLFDEPFNHLDPRSVRLLKEILREYVSGGRRGVLFSTHTTELAEQVCDRVAIVDAGRVVAEGTLAELRTRVSGGPATLEQIFLRLTDEEEGIRGAAQSVRSEDR